MASPNNTTKHFRVRFYQGQLRRDGEESASGPSLMTIMRDIASNPNTRLGYELRDFREFNGGASCQGVLATLRPDAPHIRDGEGTEREITLNADESVIEKNHFLFFRDSSLLVWQVNQRASHIRRLESYLSTVAGTPVLFLDIMSSSSVDRIANNTVKKLTIKVAKPHNRDVLPTSDWESPIFGLLNSSGGRTISVEIATRTRDPGLGERAKSAVRRLLNMEETKALKVTIVGDSEPIDLLGECIKDTISVRMEGLYPAANEVFVALNAAKDRQREALHEYSGDRAGILE